MPSAPSPAVAAQNGCGNPLSCDLVRQFCKRKKNYSVVAVILLPAIIHSDLPSSSGTPIGRKTFNRTSINKALKDGILRAPFGEASFDAEFRIHSSVFERPPLPNTLKLSDTRRIDCRSRHAPSAAMECWTGERFEVYGDFYFCAPRKSSLSGPSLRFKILKVTLVRFKPQDAFSSDHSFSMRLLLLSLVFSSKQKFYQRLVNSMFALRT